jgi:hypothetical protein
MMCPCSAGVCEEDLPRSNVDKAMEGELCHKMTLQFSRAGETTILKGAMLMNPIDIGFQDADRDAGLIQDDRKNG